jgi:hypothetical protein
VKSWSVVGCSLLCACSRGLEGEYDGRLTHHAALHTADGRAHIVDGERAASSTAKITKLTDVAYRVEVGGCNIPMETKGDETHLFTEPIHDDIERRTCSLSFPEVEPGAIPVDMKGSAELGADGSVRITIYGSSRLTYPSGSIFLEFRGSRR